MAYVKKDWEDLPDQTTPITADDLDRIENGIYDNDLKLNVGTEIDEDYKINVLYNKNLLDFSNIVNGYGLNSGNDGTYTQADRSYFDYIEVEENTEYTLGSLVWKVIQFSNNSKTFISSITSGNTFTTPANCKYVRISFDNTVVYSEAQLQKGSSNSKTSVFVENEQLFPKYNGVIYANDFKCRNLLPFDGKSFSIGNLSVSCSNGNLYFNGNVSSEILKTNSNWKNYFNFTLPAGTYTLSTTLVLSANVHIYILKYSDNSNINVDGGTFTLTEETKVYLGFYLYNQTYNNTQIVGQLEAGSEATPYTPYKYYDATDILKYQNGEIMFNVTSNLTTSYDNQSDKTLKWVGFNSQTANSPDSTASGIVISFRDLAAWGWQMAIFNGKIRIRQKQNGTWGNWVASA